MTSASFKRLAAAIVMLAVAAAGMISYASPYVALNRLKQAAEARDAETVNRYVDYPALRASLKQALNAYVARVVGAHAQDSPLARAIADAGTMIGSALIAPIVEVYATPDGVAALLAGMPPRDVANDASPPGPVRTPQTDATRRASELSACYRGLNEFVVRYRTDPKDIPYAAVFHRTGIFSWRLVGVELSGA
ncbi:hypothetical protein DFQ28_010990 [Apophysomyces sp. BC1034]|nr:hypothetical protein DFQ30_001332 [Apophysomyces sp. BC1015]KAG0191779.1 hypothetical protein DFQ28_010990 [Apophysomyces sp. BC1034]